MAGLFQILWGQEDGSFKKAEALNGTDGEPLIIPIEDRNSQTENICTRPTAVDWDGDGDLDLVVGNFAGSFYLFAGKGGGQFLPEPQLIMAGSAPLKIAGAHSDPFVVDWDKDGDIDLLSGSSNGGVQWAENVAAPGETPSFESFESLIEPGTRIEYGQPLREEDLTGPTSSTRVWVDDVNSDGQLDVLVGDSVNLISPADGLSAEELNEKQAEWQEKVNAVSEELRAATDDPAQRQEASQRLSDLFRKRSEFVKQERTGFVWLYLQK